MKYLLLTLVLLEILTVSTATDVVTQFYDNMSFSYEHHTEGSGFFSTYRRVTVNTEPVFESLSPENKKGYLIGKTGKVAGSAFTAGSGRIDNEGLLEADKVSVYRRDNTLVRTTENGSSCISGSDDNRMLYNPTIIGIGNGFYSKNPIEYQSLLREDNSIKNYHAGNAIIHEVRYADAIDTDQQFKVVGSFYQPDTFCMNPYYPATYGVTGNQITTATELSFLEDITGMIHLSAKRTDRLELDTPLMANSNYDEESSYRGENRGLMHHMKKLAVDIDEDYAGVYHLERNISFVSSRNNLRVANFVTDPLHWI